MIFKQTGEQKYLTPSDKTGLLGKGVFEDVYVVAHKNELKLYALKIPHQKEYDSSSDAMESESTMLDFVLYSINIYFFL